MILQATDKLEESIGNKYSLVIVAAKRARQLKEGHPALVREVSENPLSVALKEIEEQEVRSIAPPEEDLAPAPREVITSLVTGADFDLDEELDLEDSDAVDDLAALLVGVDDEEEEQTEAEEELLTTSEEADDEVGVDEEEEDAEEEVEAEEEADEEE
jgi:DNA-directed RNA polymerase subunit omega